MAGARPGFLWVKGLGVLLPFGWYPLLVYIAGYPHVFHLWPPHEIEQRILFPIDLNGWKLTWQHITKIAQKYSKIQLFIFPSAYESAFQNT